MWPSLQYKPTLCWHFWSSLRSNAANLHFSVGFCIWIPQRRAVKKISKRHGGGQYQIWWKECLVRPYISNHRTGYNYIILFYPTYNLITPLLSNLLIAGQPELSWTSSFALRKSRITQSLCHRASFKLQTVGGEVQQTLSAVIWVHLGLTGDRWYQRHLGSQSEGQAIGVLFCPGCMK